MTSAAEEHPSDWVTARLLVTAARELEHRWNERLREWGISHAGLVLLHLLSGGPAGQRELAGRLRVTEQTLARTVAHLESSGHVRRHQGVADRRRRTVEITPAGTALLAEMTYAEGDLTDDIVRSAGADVAALRAGLLALVQALGPARQDGTVDGAAIPASADRPAGEPPTGSRSTGSGAAGSGANSSGANGSGRPVR